MKYNKFLSFVIPAYNAGKYIQKTLNSIIDEIRTIEISSDIEIIVINDGSIDNTVNIVNNILCENSDISISLFSQENKGAGAARNTGLNLANGKYIWFFDSDDSLEKDIINYIIQSLMDNNLDLLEMGIRDCYEESSVISNILNKPINKIIDSLTYINNYNIGISPCCYIIKRDILVKNKIYFLSGVVCEDYDFCWRMFEYCNRISHLGIITYNYMIRKGSFSRRRDDEFYKFHHDSMVKIFSHVNSYFNKNSLYHQEIRKHISILKIICLIVLLKSTLPYDIRKKYFINLNRLGVLNIPRPLNMNFKQKIIYYLVRLNLFKLLFRIY